VAKKSMLIAMTLSICAAPAFAQQCLHDANETPEQVTRKRAALMVTRMINTIQFNRPEGAKQVFLRHEELANAPIAAQMKASPNPAVQQISLSPETDILPGWRLTLDVTASGYWFSVKDTTDPCGFSFISNDSGLIYTAHPLR
jgi:hypothetical protein